jgi:hypothetical protein
MRPDRPGGRPASSQHPRFSGNGKLMRARSAASPRRTRRAARAASHSNGLGPGMAAHIGEVTYPGITTLTRTPCRARPSRSASPYAFSAALLAL